MDKQPAVNTYRLGPRVPIAHPEPEPLGRLVDSVLGFAMPNRVMVARDSTSSSSSSSSTCAPDNTTGACERGVGSSTYTLPIVLGVVIPVVGAAIVFFILHRRHVKKLRLEDRNDPHASLDFGLGDVPQPGRKRNGGKKSDIDVTVTEKGRRQRQMSMDMDMTSPYLLPPELQNSRESLHSLSRTIHQNEDPYRPVTQYYPGDNSSVRSYPRQGREGSSIYTGSSNPSRLQDMATSDLLSNAGPMSKGSNQNGGFVPPPRQNSLPQKDRSPTESVSSEQPPPPPYPVEPAQAHLQESTISRKGLPASSTPAPAQSLAPTAAASSDPRDSFVSHGEAGLRASNNYLGAFIYEREASTPSLTAPSSQVSELEASSSNRKSPPYPIDTQAASPRPARKDSMPPAQPKTFMDETDEFEDYGEGFKVTPPSPSHENKAELMRGQRYSMDVPPEEFVQAGLGAPGFDARRLSMGFRPLPPDAVTETEDPETRANRIRSFYKEYFDESKPAPQGQYYEDYDENYLGDSTYYDSENNNFVMPYAQPVTRRAMTPPPRAGPRFQGPPRGMHGSMGGMSTGGIRGPPRSQGTYSPGPRAYSSASGRFGGPGPRKPMPPPMDLNTLPTPSKLRDDSFALTNATDFAPPRTYRDRVAGRSESPMGERRPYSPAVPSFVPTSSAFDELAAMPSPHMLRKSGTFTALDFAPPKKFRDPDTMSDAGSIRSNNSGISQRQLGAIRNGAYRVSRIPQDMVFTKDDLATTLKPQWGIRPGV